LSDIFREVEEDVRRERLEKFWKRYGVLVMVLAGLILAGVAGWQYWQRLQAEERARNGEAYAAAQRISDPRRAAAAFADIARDAKGTYALLAKMSQAHALNAAGQPGNAVTLYKEVGDADDGEIGAVARLRAAWIMAPASPRKELETLLAPLDKDDSAWQPLAREVLAFSDYRGAKVKQAAAAYRALSEDAKSPEGLRIRARAMANFLDNGGGADFGTVPAAEPAAALPAAPALPPLPAPAQ
jgi:hypothetical protein